MRWEGPDIRNRIGIAKGLFLVPDDFDEDNPLIRDRHVLALESLPHLHSDPFYRVLIAQARAESLLLLTRDSVLAEYGENTLLI